jgi:hypothetical protein
MADSSIDPPGGRMRFAARMRFNPQVLVFAVALLCAWPAIVGLVVSGIHVMWGGSYRQVDYRMDEVRPNVGVPYITGTLSTTGDAHLVSARKVGERYLVGEQGDEEFAPGKTIKLWWSPAAPDILIQGQRTNGVPVSALPERPGLLVFLGYLIWLVAVILIAACVAGWVLRRLAAYRDVRISN